jgi:hypothetical protein
VHVRICSLFSVLGCSQPRAPESIPKVPLRELSDPSIVCVAYFLDFVRAA